MRYRLASLGWLGNLLGLTPDPGGEGFFGLQRYEVRVNERPAPHFFYFDTALQTQLYGCRCDVLDIVVVFELLDHFQVFLVHTVPNRVFNALPDIG